MKASIIRENKSKDLNTKQMIKEAAPSLLPEKKSPKDDELNLPIILELITLL
jgi:hypothetical protein